MYKLTSRNYVIRNDGANIPVDSSNLDYKAYLAWVAQGNTPTPADVPSHNDTIDAQIRAGEAALPITHRALREFMLQILSFAHVSPNVNPKFAAIAALDAQIQALRSQRT